MTGNEYAPTGNENADHTSIWDDVNSSAVSTNSEVDAEGYGTLDDGFDGTAPLDSAKAEQIEAELATADHAGELPGDVLDGGTSERSEKFNIELTPEIYQDFTHANLDKLLRALENDVNKGEIDQRAITDELIATVTLQSALDIVKKDPNDSDAIFDDVAAQYNEISTQADNAGASLSAEMLSNQSTAVNNLKDAFDAFIRQNYTAEPNSAPTSNTTEELPSVL